MLIRHIRSAWYDDFMTDDTLRADTVWSMGRVNAMFPG